MKGFIVYSTYRTINDRAYVTLFGRLENGESFASMSYFRPYFYIKEKDLKKAQKTENFEFEKTEMKTFEGDSAVRVIMDLPKDVKEVRDELSDEGIPCYEADIRFQQRFLIDHDIKGGVDIEGDWEPGECVNRVYKEPKIKAAEYNPDLKVLSFDIETDLKTDEINAISIICDDTKETLIISNKKLKHTINCANEEQLLERFLSKILDLDPDIITGWNIIDFDFAVIYERLKKYGMPLAIGRDNTQCKLRLETNFFRDSKLDVPGRMVLDGLALTKASFLKVPDYKLDTVASKVLGEKKLLQFKNKGKELQDLFEKDPQKYADYNLKDAQLVLDILDKSGILNFTIKRSMLTGLSLDRASASIAALDSLYIRKANQKGLVVPSLLHAIKEQRIKGGFVRESEPGIYDNVLVLDFKSLYPSIMRTFNIDPASFVKDCKGKNLVKAPNGACFRNEEGIMPEILEELWKARDESRRNKDELARYAIKILMNCFTPDTLILTEQGIKKITDIKKGDILYSLNPETKEVELNKATKVFKYKYSGDMISIQSNVVDYIVTPNHRFFMKVGKNYQWIEARELVHKATRNFWLPKHTAISGKTVKTISLKKMCNKFGIKYRMKGDKLQKGHKHSSVPVTYSMKDWLELIGWYISEGGIYVSKPRRYHGKISWRGITHRVSLYQKTNKTRNEISKLAKRMGLKCSVTKDGVHISNQLLAELLEKECGLKSHRKRIPQWIFELDSSLLQYLFKTLMLGDGDADGQRYSTNNERLAEDVLRLVHHIGNYGFIYQDKQIYNGKDYIMYRVQINKKRGIQPYISKHRNIKTIPYNGYVHCVECLPNHIVLAGRNTKLNFCGQSFFGAMASPNSRFFNMDVANAITHYGQYLIKMTAEKIEEKGHKVIYQDTDSVFIVSNTDYEKALKIGQQLQDYINEFYKVMVKKEYKRKSYLELEFEKCYLKFLMPKIRGKETGAKKRYAGLLIKDGKEKIEITGLEAIRGDWTSLAQKLQKELLDRVFHGKPIDNYLLQFIKDLKAGKYDDSLVYSKQLRKGLEGYAVKTQHLKAAMKLDNFQGGVVEYVITEDGPEPVQAIRHKLDYDHYINKQIKPIAEMILTFFNIKFEDIISGNKQVSLFDYK